MAHVNVPDHGELSGLSDDDHSQYHNDARGDARYYTQTQIDAAGYYASPYIDSLGGGLIQNGSGFYGDNTNFSGFTFDPLVTNSSPGSFRHSGNYAAITTDSAFPVLPGLGYSLSIDFKVSDTNAATQFAGLVFSDVDGNDIGAVNHMFDNGTLAELTRDFEHGVDTSIYIDDDTGFSFGTAQHTRGFIFWDYESAGGFAYPPNTYSRRYILGLTHSSASVTDIGGGEFEIATETSGYTRVGIGDTEIIPAGTKLSRINSGGTYKYTTAFSFSVPTDGAWHNKKGYIGGVDATGTNKSNSIPPGASTAKIVFLANYSGSHPDTSKLWVANIDFRVDDSINLVKDGALVTTGALGTIDYYRGFKAEATSGSVSSTTVIS